MSIAGFGRLRYYPFGRHRVSDADPNPDMNARTDADATETDSQTESLRTNAGRRGASRVEAETAAEERTEEESPERSPLPSRNPGQEMGNHGTAPAQQSRPARQLAGSAFFTTYYCFQTGDSSGNTPHGTASTGGSTRRGAKKGGRWWQ